MPLAAIPRLSPAPTGRRFPHFTQSPCVPGSDIVNCVPETNMGLRETQGSSDGKPKTNGFHRLRGSCAYKGLPVTKASNPEPLAPIECTEPEHNTSGSRKWRRAGACEKLPVTWTVNPGPLYSQSIVTLPKTEGHWFPHFTKSLWGLRPPVT